MRLHTAGRSCSSVARRGVAAVEVALITAFFLVPLVIGVWEIGRMVQVQQIVTTAAREGARLAAQGYTINSSGSITQVMVSVGDPNVTDTVYRSLIASGLTQLQKSDITVSFQFTAPGLNGTPTEPYLGSKGQPFMLTVTINSWAKVRWINLGIINPSNVTYTVSWQMLVDDQFTVSTDLPAPDGTTPTY